MAAGHEEEHENEIINTPDWSNQTQACLENLESAVVILNGDSNGILEASPLSIEK